MTAPDRIYAAPPWDDPQWESGSGEWDVSDAWAHDGLTEYVNASLYNKLLEERNAFEAFINSRNELWMKTSQNIALLLEIEADREAGKSAAAVEKGLSGVADRHAYAAKAFRRQAKSLRSQPERKKVPLNLSE